MIKLAGLGFGAVLVMALLWLFTLNQVADTAATASAAAIDESLTRSLEPGAKCRVTMVREGTGIDAPRRYIVRFRPSSAVASDPNAVARLSERAARIVAGRLDAVKAPVQIHCVAGPSDAEAVQHCFRRTGGDEAWDLEPVVPVPPLPSAAAETSGAESPK